MYTVELKTSIKIDQGRNVYASVATEMDRKDDVQIRTMRDVIQELVRGYGNENSEIKTNIKPHSPAVKMVSEKQIGMLRYLLNKTNTPESDFCRRYSVHQLNELTMADAKAVATRQNSTPAGSIRSDRNEAPAAAVQSEYLRNPSMESAFSAVWR